MSDYGYVAINQQGKKVKGNIVADNEGDARILLKKNSYMLINIKRQSAWNRDLNFEFHRKIKLRSISIFCRQFVSMLNAGVSILNALTMLEEQTEDKHLAAGIRELRVEVEKGRLMSEVMKEMTEVFPILLADMITAGEASGNIELALDRAATQFEKQTKLKGLMKQSMMYPIVLLAVILIILFVMIGVVIPNYAVMYEDIDTKLPAVTLVLMAMGNFMQTKWYLIPIIVVGLFLLNNVFRKSVMGMNFYGHLAMKLPIFGKLNMKTYSASFARTFSSLMAAGIPMVKALDSAAGTMQNYVIRTKLLNCKEAIATGIPLSETLISEKVFPPMVVHMTAIGEEAGDIEGMLTKVADYYDDEVEVGTKTAMAALEPLMILVMAGIVVVLIYAILAPMLGMYDSLGNM